MIKTLVSTLLLTLGAAAAWGQETRPAPAEGWQTTFFEAPTVALPLLTAAAVQHSAQLKALDKEVAISQQDVQIAKKGILNIVSLGGSYTYGNLAGVALADPSNPSQFTTFSSGRYSTGVGVTLPLDRVATRGNTIRREKLNVERAQSLRQERENEIRQLVIQSYQNVLLAKKLLTIRQEASVTVQTSYRLAEKQFRQGQLSLPDFSVASNSLTEVAVAETSARTQYETAFMLLEELTGARISTLMTNR
ncbi:TolC family protein [Hymenobacter daeguensis]